MENSLFCIPNTTFGFLVLYEASLGIHPYYFVF